MLLLPLEVLKMMLCLAVLRARESGSQGAKYRHVAERLLWLLLGLLLVLLLLLAVAGCQPHRLLVLLLLLAVAGCQPHHPSMPGIPHGRAHARRCCRPTLQWRATGPPEESVIHADQSTWWR